MAKRPSKLKKIKHAVQVVRFRMEYAIVEFDAVPSQDETKIKTTAEKLAAKLPDAEWKIQKFNRRTNKAHAVKVASQEDVDDCLKDSGERRRAKWFANLVEDSPHSVRYMVLRGDQESGEGEVLNEPWFETDPRTYAHPTLDEIGSTYFSPSGSSTWQTASTK